MSQRSLPGGPEEITPEWFTTIFHENSIITSGEVVGVQTDLIGQDQGFTGVIARVRLQYAASPETTPSSVVVKIPTANRDAPSAYRASQEKDMTAARRYARALRQRGGVLPAGCRTSHSPRSSAVLRCGR